jgi:deferrochelatase/peroxidase EfeB
VNQSLVTIVGRLPGGAIDEARRLIDALGNPAAPPMRSVLDAMPASPDSVAIHFASLNAFPAPGRAGGYLVFEFSGDGDEAALLSELAGRLGPSLAPIFALTEDRDTGTLEEYWTAHVVRVGAGYFDNAGLVFSGSPGLSVHRILRERDLAAEVVTLLDAETSERASALVQVQAVRERIAASPEWTWSLIPEDVAVLHPERPLGVEAVLRIAASFAWTYLWPVFALLATVFFVVWLISWFRLSELPHAVRAVGYTAVISAIAVGLGAGAAYLVIRRMEREDVPEHRRPDAEALARVFDRENRTAQNHLAGLFVMKSGKLRKLAIRFAFLISGQLVARHFRPGFLGTLGTIHFARWVTVPGTGDLLFLSNYDGSWESYLEDFITRAHAGLTVIWSNTVGFPRTRNLFQEGATDGTRFKNWARRWQIPTGFWYSAYPDLTMATVRRNAAIRQGLAAALTEDEAQQWLSYFGSQPRPPSSLEVNEIQSLVFGGLGFLRFGMCLGFRLGAEQAAAKHWLKELLPYVTFGDGRKHRDAAVILGLGATALPKFGLPPESVTSFPQAFIDGMCASWRSRALGDMGENAPDQWWWGGTTSAPLDGVLLLYAPTRLALTRLRRRLTALLSSASGHELVFAIPFKTLPGRHASPEQQQEGKTEPFGFADGISQPLIRGTYKALRAADPIHLVEAGEFVLGYPDNRGYISPGPTLDAILDPDGALPIAAVRGLGFDPPAVNDLRDLGRNGSFLAVRQLEQDVESFWRYCADAAPAIADRFPSWQGVTPEFVAAKLVGRWPDGSSIVRYPYAPASASEGDLLLVRVPGAAGALPATDVATPVLPIRRDPAGATIVEPDNDFMLGAEDPQGLRCPFGAHIRRANPRESLDPGSAEQLSITNRHRILRVGRRYRPRKGQKPGLFFMCLNADLERQFEFVQQTWLQHGSFHGLAGERDALIGTRQPGAVYSVPTRSGSVRLTELPGFVRTRGGGYFFVSSRAVLQHLAR